MSRINSKIKNEIVLLLSCFVGHPVFTRDTRDTRYTRDTRDTRDTKFIWKVIYDAEIKMIKGRINLKL